MKYKSPTLHEWFDKAEKYKDVLLKLISAFHPAMYAPMVYTTLPITAEGPEKARKNIVEEIKKDHQYDDISVITQFLNSIEEKDYITCGSILNATWFGVPESMAAWNCIGFRECVELLEDPPDEE